MLLPCQYGFIFEHHWNRSQQSDPPVERCQQELAGGPSIASHCSNHHIRIEYQPHRDPKTNDITCNISRGRPESSISRSCSKLLHGHNCKYLLTPETFCPQLVTNHCAVCVHPWPDVTPFDNSFV